MFDEFRPGIQKGDHVIDISSLLAGVETRKMLPTLIENRAKIESAAAKLNGQHTRPLASVRLRQPAPDPVQMCCAARNYVDHHQAPKPDFFQKPYGAIIGPGDTMIFPEAQATVFNAEPELAVIIGKRAATVPAAKAMDHVFGYTCLFDGSARGLSTGFYIHKSFATFAPIGPAIVTADEIADPHALRIRMWADDDLRQDFSTGQMANRIEKLIEAASSVCPLETGDVLATGTYHVGLGPIQDGQTISMEIDGIGRLSVKIRDPLKRAWGADGKPV